MNIKRGKIVSVGNRKVDVKIDGSDTVVKSCALPSEVNLASAIIGASCTISTYRDGDLVLSIDGNNQADQNVEIFNEYQIDYISNTVNNTYNQTIQIISGTTISDPMMSGKRFFTHGSRLAATLLETDEYMYVQLGVFTNNEIVWLEQYNGQQEFILTTSEAENVVIPGTNVRADRYSITRGVMGTLAKEFPVYLMVHGLTQNGYIMSQARDDIRSPSLRVLKWTDTTNWINEEVVRIGNLNYILGYETSVIGFAVGNLDTANTYLLYDSESKEFTMKNVSLKIVDSAENNVLNVFASDDENEHYAGDVIVGLENNRSLQWKSQTSSLHIYSQGNNVLVVDQNGARIEGELWIYGNNGISLGLGLIDGLSSIIMRDEEGVPVFSAREDPDTNGVQVLMGRPEPNYGWARYLNGLFEVNGIIRAQELQLLGQTTGTPETEITLDDPESNAQIYITPKFLEGLDVDGNRTALISWGNATRLIDPNNIGLGYRTWIGGEVYFGDWLNRHFRVERGPTARVGLFDGETGKAYLDASGDLYLTGSITAQDGQIGGWIITASTLESEYLILNSLTPAIYMGNEVSWNTGNGFVAGKFGGVYKLRIGNPIGQGNGMVWDGSSIFYNGTSGTLNNQLIAKTSDLDMEVMKLNFQNLTWAGYAILDTFEDESKRLNPETATYPARVYYGMLDNGGDGTANRPFVFNSQIYWAITRIRVANSTSVGAGYIEDTTGTWENGQYKNYEVYDGADNWYLVKNSTSSPRRLILNTTSTPTGGSYKLWGGMPTQCVAFASYKDSTNGGYGYVKLEASWDAGAHWQTLLDTESSVNYIGGNVAITNSETHYQFRITLKNDSQGRGAEFYKVLIMTDPSVWK